MTTSPLSVRIVVAALFLVALLSVVPSASAQTMVRVRVTADRAVIWRPRFLAALTLARKGAEFEVRSRQGDWYEVVIPAAGGTPRLFGFLAVTQGSIISGAPPARQAPPDGASRVTPATTQAAMKATRKPPSWAGRGFVTIGGGERVTSSSTTTTWKVPMFAEQATYEASYPVKTGPTFGGGGAVRLISNLGAFVTVSRFASKQPATIDLSVPHPFFFNTPRKATGESGSLQRSEIEIDLDALWLAPIGRDWEITVYGGAAVFSASQDIVSHVQFTDVYPYDSITFVSASTERVSKTQVGYNLGADVVYKLNRRTGIAGGVRFSRANTDFVRTDGTATAATLGGADVTVSFRVRF